MFVVIGNAAACLRLASIIFGESLPEKFVVLVFNILSAVGYVIPDPFAVNILCDKLSVVMLNDTLVNPKRN